MDTATGNASRNWNRRVWLATASSRACSARSAIHTANATNAAVNTANTATARTVPETICWSRSATAAHTSTAAPSVTAPAGIANHGPRRSVRCQVNANIPTASTTIVPPVNTAIDTSAPQPNAADNPAACPNNDTIAIAAINDPAAATTATRRPGHGHHGATANTPTPASTKPVSYTHLRAHET